MSQPQTVVVLEDDADISRLVQYHLEGAGFTVRPYLAIGQVLSDAERHPPALFLLDIMVPGGDGLDLCRRLRQNPTLSSIPIIFLTARAAENDRVQGLELGADDYITKPFATRELVASTPDSAEGIGFPPIPRSGVSGGYLRFCAVGAVGGSAMS